MELSHRYKTLVSPLRYPGGKRRVAPFILETLRRNNLKPELFVEPFAGGATVALFLLANDQVDQIALGERDPLVASFWRTVFYDTDWIIDQIEHVEVTVTNWEKFRNGAPKTARDRALACLFLNRTSFSGILAKSAGPIGGKQQNSPYKIDCRFPRDLLCSRIRNIAAFAERIAFIRAGRWETTLKKASGLVPDPGKLMFYFDPPFYNKAAKLYTHHFKRSEHNALFNTVHELRSNWILSYDVAQPILDLYTGTRNGHTVQILYSASSRSLVSATELFITNLASAADLATLWSAPAEEDSGVENEGSSYAEQH